MTGHRTGEALGALAAPLRRRSTLVTAVAVVGSMLAVLGATAWLARIGVLRTPLWVLLAWAGAFSVGGWIVREGWRVLRRFAPDPLAEMLEASGQFRAGSVRLLLEPSALGTSEGLFGAADLHQAGEVRREGPVALADTWAGMRRRTRLALVAAAGGVGLLATAGPVGGTAAALWRPDLAWEAAVAPVRLAASAEAVDRGESVTLTLLATGRRNAVLWTRAPGEAWTAREVALDSAGRGEEVVGPLTGDLFARLTAGNRGSDTLHITVRLPVFLGALTVTAEYPGYLGLDPEPLPVSGDTLLLPAGTRLRTVGRATGPLARAVWEHETGPAPLEVTGDGFSGSFTPEQSGVWRLAVTTTDGMPLTGEAAWLAIRVVPDSAPIVEVPVPGVDTLSATGMVVPLVVDARDDHGLRRVTLETRRGADAPRLRELVLPEGAVDRALLTTALDLTELGMEPGDSLRYHVRATDNAPAPRTGRSREFLLVLPTRSALREAQREATDAMGRQLDSLASQSRALQQETEDLARQRPRRDPAGGNAESMSFEEARRAEEVARAQAGMMEEVREVQEALRDLERAAEAAGIADSTFERRMAEIREELARALSPELRRKLEELQEALRNLDAPKARDALRELTEAQKQMREALERTKELFERAALEGELGALGQEAAEVAQAQQRWADSVMRADSAQAAAQERALAQRADSLASGIERAAARMDSDSARQQMTQAAEAAREAAQQMRQAAQSAQQGQRQRAQQQGQQAQAQMGQVEQQVTEQRAEQQEAWREEVIRALDQALLETTRLTRRQLTVAQSFRRGVAAATLRLEQAAVEEGARQLLEQVMTAGGKNALVPPQISGALAAARQQMALARNAISTANLNLRDGAERAGEAVDALNVAAFMLLRARGDVAGSASGSGMAEAMERMAQMAQQQGGIGEDAMGLLPQMGSAGAEQRLQQLAARQRQLAQELDRLRAETNAGAAEEFAREARELAREMAAGRLDAETVARQERLFRRMLDAGRTLQGEEEDEQKERESRSARDAEIRLPPALRARLLGRDGAPRLPTWEELQRYTPEERRLVADYFRRLGVESR